MSHSLYKKNDGVVVLSDKNFTGNKLTKGFKGAGVLKAYAVWCPHCQDKVEDFKRLAKAFRAEKIGLNVYVIEADVNRGVASAQEIEGFPTMMFVDHNGNVSRLNNKGQPSHDVPSILTALCDTKKKCLSKKTL
jgi:thiol-disulfide isomerase/thioredoxin